MATLAFACKAIIVHDSPCFRDAASCFPIGTGTDVAHLLACWIVSTPARWEQSCWSCMRATCLALTSRIHYVVCSSRQSVDIKLPAAEEIPVHVESRLGSTRWPKHTTAMCIQFILILLCGVAFANCASNKVDLHAICHGYSC